jgi:hypothetical protein
MAGTGNMTKVGADAWYINTVDVTSQINSAITVSRPILATQPWICTSRLLRFLFSSFVFHFRFSFFVLRVDVTLEAYGIYDCSLLPTGTVPFTKLQLYAFTTRTHAHTPNSKCATHRTVERDLTTPKWETGNQNPFCTTTIKVTDPSTVVIGLQ